MEKSRPVVSVIIPVYNGEEYLAEAIESVLAQTYRPVEIIVVDDGSTDKSGDVAKGFQDRGVRYFFQPNSGIGAARNQGTNLARGSYFAFLDADDVWLPDKLTLQMTAFGEDPGLDMVFGQVSEYYDSSSDAQLITMAADDGKILAGYFAGTLVIKRKSFSRVGPFATQWRVGEFVDWFAKATETGLRNHLIPEVVMRRRIHSTNVGIRERGSQVDYIRILKQALDRRREKSVPTSLQRPDEGYDEDPS
jgi:glycosyltransferase involved in cell wall biosynthesis